MQKITNNIWTKCLMGYITILFIAGIACVCSAALLTTPPANETDWIKLFNRMFTSGLMDYFKISIAIDIALNIALLPIMALFSISIKKYRLFAPATILLLLCILASIIFIFSIIGVGAIGSLAGGFSVYVVALLMIIFFALGLIYAVSFYNLINSSISKIGK